MMHYRGMPSMIEKAMHGGSGGTGKSHFDLVAGDLILVAGNETLTFVNPFNPAGPVMRQVSLSDFLSDFWRIFRVFLMAFT